MAGDVTIRRLKTIDELSQMQQVEQSVWQMSPNPVHQTYTALLHGGIILGAFDDTRMVGFLYSFAGYSHGITYLCSHMLGILPAYRKYGLGTRMKRKQAEVARELGYSMITWTFDPLESQNAYLNLHKLGAIAASYKANYYGAMNDQLNQGLPTDRFQIEWHLDSTESEEVPLLNLDKVLLDVDENGNPVLNLNKFNPETDSWFVAIPWYFQGMKKNNIELAKEWRRKTGQAFRTLFENGFLAKDLINDSSKKVSYYYFSR